MASLNAFIKGILVCFGFFLISVLPGGSSVAPLACCLHKTVGRLTYLLVGREDTAFMILHGCITAHWQLDNQVETEMCLKTIKYKKMNHRFTFFYYFLLNTSLRS